MKKKYLVIAGIVTVMEAMLFGCAASPMGAGMSGKAGIRAVEEQTQAADTDLKDPMDVGGDFSGREDRGGSDGGEDSDGRENSGSREDGTERGGPDGAKEEIRNMVMLDGKLYVDTYETNSMLRCGTMDGTITSTTDGAVPLKDGQSNFGKDIGFQYGMRENRIEICLDDGWHVFAYNENNLEGVSLEMTEVSKSGGTVAVHNETDQEITFGEDFTLELFDPETKEWSNVQIVADGEWAVNDIGFPVSGKETREWEVDWTWLYGELMPGRYRIVKGILSETKKEGMQTVGSGPYVKYTLSAEFEI